MLSRPYKTIFFDWNKTLSYSRFWQQLEDTQHPHYEVGKQISKFLFTEQKSLIQLWMRGLMSTTDILREIQKFTGIPYNFLQKELKQSCEEMSFGPDDIINQIQQLRREGIRCVIATDNMDTFREYTIPALKLTELFDDFLISNELGVLKFEVDKETSTIPFFDNYLKKNNLNYEDVALIDDCVDDGFYVNIGFKIFQVHAPHDIQREIQNFLEGPKKILV